MRDTAGWRWVSAAHRSWILVHLMDGPERGVSKPTLCGRAEYWPCRPRWSDRCSYCELKAREAGLTPGDVPDWEG